MANRDGSLSNELPELSDIDTHLDDYMWSLGFLAIIDPDGRRSYRRRSSVSMPNLPGAA